MNIYEFQNKYLEFILMFEKETGRHAIYHNKITKNFKHWFKQRIKYKNLKCNDSNCPKFGQEFPSIMSLAQHINWHKPGYRENHSGENSYWYGRHLSEETKKKISNKNRGKIVSEETKRKMSKASIKENATNEANHKWINKHYPQKEICDDKCEVCGEFRLDLELARFIHIDVRNMDNPMIDYMYICPITEKNSCHRIYDMLNNKQKKELLNGAITREEKLKRVKEYVLKIKDIRGC